MRVVEEVLGQLRRRYRQDWRDWLLTGAGGPFSFSLVAPTAEAIARESDEVGRWLRAWRSWAEVNPAAQLRSAVRRTAVGPQMVFTHLDLPGVAALAALDPELAGHWQRANARWAQLRALPGGVLEKRLRPWLQQIVDLREDDFTILLSAVRWFTGNPRSGLTIRQVPVFGMHTKWLARNRRLVLACLDIGGDQTATADQTDAELAQDDLDPLGLKLLPVHVDVILADPDDRALVGGLRHLRAPLPEIAALPVHPDLVVIVENKESAYLVPDRPRTVVVHSLGNHLNVLDEIGWLTGACHLYWGDVDRAGFTLLSRARARLTRTVSVLMDAATLEEHRPLAVCDKQQADPPNPNLTDLETATLSALTAADGTHLRLEQERILATYVRHHLDRAMDDHGSHDPAGW